MLTDVKSSQNIDKSSQTFAVSPQAVAKGAQRSTCLGLDICEILSRLVVEKEVLVSNPNERNSL